MNDDLVGYLRGRWTGRMKKLPDDPIPYPLGTRLLLGWVDCKEIRLILAWLAG